jgi:hypothetical protein
MRIKGNGLYRCDHYYDEKCKGRECSHRILHNYYPCEYDRSLCDKTHCACLPGIEVHCTRYKGVRQRYES